MGIRNAVSTPGARRRFIIAIWSSYSKSETARTPRRMSVAPDPLRVVDQQSVEAVDLDVVEAPGSHRAAASSRSSTVNIGSLSSLLQDREDRGDRRACDRARPDRGGRRSPDRRSRDRRRCASFPSCASARGARACVLVPAFAANSFRGVLGGIAASVGRRRPPEHPGQLVDPRPPSSARRSRCRVRPAATRFAHGDGRRRGRRPAEGGSRRKPDAGRRAARDARPPPRPRPPRRRHRPRRRPAPAPGPAPSRTTCSASITRESSPPEARPERPCAGSPGLAASRNSARRRRPRGPRERPAAAAATSNAPSRAPAAQAAASIAGPRRRGRRRGAFEAGAAAPRRIATRGARLPPRRRARVDVLERRQLSLRPSSAALPRASVLVRTPPQEELLERGAARLDRLQPGRVEVGASR